MALNVKRTTKEARPLIISSVSVNGDVNSLAKLIDTDKGKTISPIDFYMYDGMAMSNDPDDPYVKQNGGNELPSYSLTTASITMDLDKMSNTPGAANGAILEINETEVDGSVRTRANLDLRGYTALTFEERNEQRASGNRKPLPESVKSRVTVAVDHSLSQGRVGGTNKDLITKGVSEIAAFDYLHSNGKGALSDVNATKKAVKDIGSVVSKLYQACVTDAIAYGCDGVSTRNTDEKGEAVKAKNTAFPPLSKFGVVNVDCHGMSVMAVNGKYVDKTLTLNGKGDAPISTVDLDGQSYTFGQAVAAFGNSVGARMSQLFNTPSVDEISDVKTRQLIEAAGITNAELEAIHTDAAKAIGNMISFNPRAASSADVKSAEEIKTAVQCTYIQPHMGGTHTPYMDSIWKSSNLVNHNLEVADVTGEITGKVGEIIPQHKLSPINVYGEELLANVNAIYEVGKMPPLAKETNYRKELEDIVEKASAELDGRDAQEHQDDQQFQ